MTSDGPEPAALLSEEDRTFLRGLAGAAIAAASVAPRSSATDKHGRPIGRPNTLGFAAIRPGGRACYPAIWVQDFTMTYACGLVPRETGLSHLRCILGRQNGPRPRELAGGARIPAFAVPDHVNLDGSAVFFPGTYDPGDAQGGEPWGLRPPLNNPFDCIWLAWMLAREGPDGAAVLRSRIEGLSLIERLQAAFDAIGPEEHTGLAVTSAEARAVGFIFCDSIFMTGRLLTASLLRWRAAGHLRDLYALLGPSDRDADLAGVQARIAEAVPVVFAPRPHRGWLRAATGVCGQDDVWGTLYALHLGILKGPTAERAREQVLSAVEAGTILHEGAVRHVPTDGDASPRSAWERTHTPGGRYQNGAYWHMPTGWLISALGRRAPQAARGVLADFVAHMRRHDFRRGPDCGAPWECIGPEREAWQNDTFLPSITMPLAVLAPARRRAGGAADAPAPARPSAKRT
jgi:hypothetical protein